MGDMRWPWIIVPASLVAAGCGSDPSPSPSSPIDSQRATHGDTRAKVDKEPDDPCSKPLEAAAAVTLCVGKTIVLVGIPARSKQATLLGVDIDGDYDGESKCSATGLLERYTVEPPKAEGLIAASRGPGTYLRLLDPHTRTIARAKCTKH